MFMKLLSLGPKFINSCKGLLTAWSQGKMLKRRMVLLMVVVFFVIQVVMTESCKNNGYIGEAVDQCVSDRMDLLIDSVDELVLINPSRPSVNKVEDSNFGNILFTV